MVAVPYAGAICIDPAYAAELSFRAWLSPKVKPRSVWRVLYRRERKRLRRFMSGCGPLVEVGWIAEPMEFPC